MSEPGRTPEHARQWRLVKQWAHEDNEWGRFVRGVLRDVLEGWS